MVKPCCLDCGKKLSDKRHSRCRVCANHMKRKTQVLCKDCGAVLTNRRATRCHLCYYISLKGRTFSEQTRSRIAKTLTGRPMPEETREKIGNSLRGRKQKPRTLEHSAKIVKSRNENGTYDPVGTVRKIGGRGYFYIKAYIDKGRRNWVMYHRFLIEQRLGRELCGGEIVHVIKRQGYFPL